MRPRVLAALLAALLASGPLAYGQAGDPETEKGIRQAQEGEFEQAIVTLQGALPRLLEGKAPPRDIARAHVYLGIAHLGLNDPAAARTSFLEAIRVDPTLKLGSDEYPPRIVRAFEDARRSASPPPTAGTTPNPKPAAPPTTSPAPAMPPVTPAAPPAAKARPVAAKKGGSKLPYVLLGVGAVGGGVALAAAGGGSPGADGERQPHLYLPAPR
jgi:hypothetical protein